jgi:hypothetical protein
MGGWPSPSTVYTILSFLSLTVRCSFDHDVLCSSNNLAICGAYDLATPLAIPEVFINCAEVAISGSGPAPVPAPVASPVAAPTGNSTFCGGGNVGNGICADRSCCSEWGYCGCSTAHCTRGQTCGGSAPAPAPVPAPTSSSGSRGDWELCGSSRECRNGCCSSRYSNDGRLKCTPLSGGFRPDICVS